LQGDLTRGDGNRPRHGPRERRQEAQAFFAAAVSTKKMENDPIETDDPLEM
tara:strand:- start:43 stop:195 length:153 start_codon:yes stop_codon:yes gene_type:complete